MSSKCDFFQGLCLKPRPTELNGSNRLFISNPNSLLVRPNPSSSPSLFLNENVRSENVFTRSQYGSLLTATGSTATTVTDTTTHTDSTTIHNQNSKGGVSFRTPYVLPPKPAGLVINLMPKLEQLRSIRQQITSRQLQNIVQMKRILNANNQNNQRNVNNSNVDPSSSLLLPAPPSTLSSTAPTPVQSGPLSMSATNPQSPNRFHPNHHHHHHQSPSSYLNCAVNEAKASLAVNSKNEAKLRDRRAKFLKHLCKLEFSSLLFRKVYFRVHSLTNRINYEQILEYEQFCGTSNKNSIKQNLYKTHLLKCKTSRSRTRMLRSSEIVNGKLTESWQRSDYAHVYTFSRRQRLKRYQQIQLSLGFQKRILRLVYQRMEIKLPKLLECPACKEKLDADRGHCCARRKMRRTKGTGNAGGVSLLSKQHHHHHHHQQQQSNGGLKTAVPGSLLCPDQHGNNLTAPLRMSLHRNNLKNTSTPPYTAGKHPPSASGSGFGNRTTCSSSITESTTLMSIQQGQTEYYDYRPGGDQQQLNGLLPDLMTNESLVGSDMDGDDINIVKVIEPVGKGGKDTAGAQSAMHDGAGLNGAGGRPRRKCNSTLLLDSSNFKDNSSPLVIKRVAYDSDLNQIKSSNKNDDEDIKMDAIQLRRIKPSQFSSTVASNRVQSRMIQMTHENLLPVDKTIEISYE